MLKHFLITALLTTSTCHAENQQDKANRPSNIVWDAYLDYIIRPLDLYIVRPCEKYRIVDIAAGACAIALPFIAYYSYLLHKTRSLPLNHE
jgi:hypothetical protein